MERFVRRHQPSTPCACLVKAAIGIMLGVAFIGWLGGVSGVPLLIAPFGATAILVFGVPRTPLAQPANVIGGHLIATAASLALRAVLPPEWWAMGLAVGVAALLMAALRITHPPAGGDPIIVFLSDPGPWFLALPVGAGAVVLVLLAFIFHKAPPVVPYPLPGRPDEGSAPVDPDPSAPWWRRIVLGRC